MSGKRIKSSDAEFRKRAEEKNKKDKLIISQTPKIQSLFKKVRTCVFNNILLTYCSVTYLLKNIKYE